MAEIIVKEANREKIEQLVKEAEGRARERTITFSTFRDIETAIRDITIGRFGFASKRSMEGLEIVADVNAQKYPKAYKYRPQATFFKLKFEKQNWRLMWVERRDQDKNRTDRYEVVNMPESLKQAVMARFKSF